MRVMILEHTPNPEKVVSRAAKQCYDAGFVGDTYEDALAKSDIDRIRKVYANGHLSCFEHASFTFAIEGISRSASHQLVRFRVASFSQQSQRYCFLGKSYPRVTPPTIKNVPPLEEAYNDLLDRVGLFYARLVDEGIPAEDARFVLPNACETNIIMTMNARELLHAFGLRCCTHAQWEIRDMFNEMLPMCKAIAPILFEKAGAPCDVSHTCPEGERSCGRIVKF